MSPRTLLWMLFTWLADQCVDPRLKRSLPLAHQILDQQLHRAVIDQNPGLAVRGIEAAVEAAVGLDHAPPAHLLKQLSALHNPILFAFQVAKQR